MKEKMNEKWFQIGIVFTILFLVCTYKLTNASLWFDETIEYYYSESFVGLIPGWTEVSNMYDRIVSTFQPPLYNVLMFFWLKISSSEWWFRFFGVVMGMVGAVGIYKAVEKIWNYQAAAVSVLVLACTRSYIYYVQECAEYNLMLAAISWFMFAWLCFMEKVTPKRLFGFLLAAIICVYSQYGTVFPVAAFSIAAFLYIISRKEKSEIFQIAVGYGLAVVFAAVPLWFFFLRKQMQNQQSTTVHTFTITDGILTDIYNAIKQVAGWCFAYDSFIFIIIPLLLFILILLFSKKIWMKWLVVANLLCIAMYYVAVKLSFYSYGSFGGRYCLFFIPIWIICLFGVLFGAKEIIKEFFEKRSNKALYQDLIHRKNIFNGICLAVALVFCITGWDTIKSNWSKEDIRGATDAWYAAEGYNVSTLIYYASTTGFSYYCEQDERYDNSKLDNVVLMEWYRDKTVDEYNEYLNRLYNGVFPENLYVIASHWRGDLGTILQCFTDNGYATDYIYDKSGGRLIYLSKDNNGVVA